MKQKKPQNGGLSTDRILSACLQEAKNFFVFSDSVKHLDIGAGNGALLKMFKSSFRSLSYACDYTDKLIEVDGLKVDVCDLNKDQLPYESDYFDVITLTEVIEHIENHRSTLCDIFRILKPNGILILSTPNILNLKSRIRFLFCGFWNLFGPLPVGNRKIETTGGHINPISYFYIVHSLKEAGFKIESETYDKIQKSSFFITLLMYFPIKIFAFFHRRKEIYKYKTIDSTNRDFVFKMNTFPLMVGRTIIVTARKT